MQVSLQWIHALFAGEGGARKGSVEVDGKVGFVTQLSVRLTF